MTSPHANSCPNTAVPAPALAPASAHRRDVSLLVDDISETQGAGAEGRGQDREETGGLHFVLLYLII